MGLFDRLFGKKPEQPTSQKAELPAEETSEQRKQRETEIYIAKRGKPPRVLNEEDKARIREEDGQKRNKMPRPNLLIKPELPGQIDVPPLKEIGVVDLICPYCGEPLERMPERKKKCPHCSNYILVRTRPLDGKRVLIREDQKEEMDEQRAIKNDLYTKYSADRWATKDEFEAMRQELRKRTGREPLEGDIQWQLFNKQALEHASNYNMGLYTNVVLYRAEFLQREGRIKQAFITYLELCYLDLNGPFNCGGINSPDLLMKYPPFNPRHGLLPPGILVRIDKLSNHLKLSKDEIRTLFLKHNEIVASAMKLPVSPPEAWARIERELTLEE